MNDQQSTGNTKSAEAPPQFSFLHTVVAKAVQGDRECKVRAALDSGALSSLITEAMASHLKLKRYPQRVNLNGAHADVTSKHYVKVKLQSYHDETKFITAAFSVVPSLPAAHPPSNTDLDGTLDMLLGGLDMGESAEEDIESVEEYLECVKADMYGIYDNSCI